MGRTMASIVTLVDRVKIFAQSSGTGPFQLGSAVPAYRGVEALVDGAQYRYALENDANFEVGTGTYVAGSGLLIRTPIYSSAGGAAVAFPANMQITFTELAIDLTPAGSLPITQSQGQSTDVAMSQKAVTDALAAIGGAVPVIASENIDAGNFVAYLNVAGEGRMFKARADDPAKFAVGYVLSPVTAGQEGNVYFGGLNSTNSISNPASEVWLSDTTPGWFSYTRPSAVGSIIQPLGPYLKGRGIFFSPRERFLNT